MYFGILNASKARDVLTAPKHRGGVLLQMAYIKECAALMGMIFSGFG